MKATLLNRILIVLAFVGLFIAGVLSIEAGLKLDVPCGPSRGCAIVAADPSSKWGGIPVAYFGLLGYILLAGLAIYRSTLPVSQWKRWASLGYLVAAIGAMVSLYLQYQSLVVIHATCLWCMSSAITMILTLFAYGFLAQGLENEIAAIPQSFDEEPAPNEVVRPDFKLSGILAILMIVGVLTVGSTMNPAGASKSAPKDANIADLIPAGAHILGIDTAPVTIVEFADLCCPSCQKYSPKVKEFVLQHPGKIRLVYRNYPLDQLHPEALTAAAIAECASDEGRFWDYAMAVMALQRQPKDSDELLDIAKSTGLDVEKIRTRLQNNNDPAYARIDRDLKEVHKLGVTSTPTFFIILGTKVDSQLGPNDILEDLNSPKIKKLIGSGT